MEILRVQFFIYKPSIFVIYLLFNTGVKKFCLFGAKFGVLCYRGIVKGSLGLANKENVSFSCPLFNEFFR